MRMLKAFLIGTIILFFSSCSIGQAPKFLSNITSPSSQDENKVRTVVKNFGTKLQKVSLLSPVVKKEMKENYSRFVTQDLLDEWMSIPQEAPGRQVSSPWPDRIEITNIQKESSTKYRVDGEIIEVTSVEVVNGGAANKIPVHLVVKYVRGEWLISGFE